MSNSLMTVSEKMTLIEKTEGKISYRLYSLASESGNVYYALEASTKECGELAVIGSDLGSAVVLYERVVRGEVSPVTLLDIVHDASESEKY